MEEAERVREGDRVTAVQHNSWTADTMGLARSGRVGIVDKLFTPIGGSPVTRVIFPKEGRYKEWIEFFAPRDIQPAIDPSQP
jgi:hypothetical protein